MESQLFLLRVLFCLSLCLLTVLASVIEYPLDRYGASETDTGVYYESYGPDLAPYQGTLYEKEQEYERKKYSFDYGVNDPHTGDQKQAWEVSDGTVVRGGYSFVEADGTERIVEYTADPINGFRAVVKRIGLAQHPGPYEKKYPSYDLPSIIPAPPIDITYPRYTYTNPLPLFGLGATSYQNQEQS